MCEFFRKYAGQRDFISLNLCVFPGGIRISTHLGPRTGYRIARIGAEDYLFLSLPPRVQ